MKLLALLVAGAVMVSPARAQQPSFAPLDRLVGHCWIGTFPDGKQTDEHCFEWVYDRKFIRDRHVVRNGPGPYEGETLYSWDPKAKQVVYSYYSSAGQVITGVMQASADGAVFPSRFDTPQGTVEIRAVWSGLSDQGYTVSQSQKAGTEWKPLWTMTLKRRGN